jgi:membrane protein implicated in regulation of membrane protease activity
MTWWLWLVLGLLLAGMELATPGGFYLIFFGLSALLIAVLELLGFAGPVWVQWLLFSVLSVGFLLLFRNPLLRMLRPADLPVDQLIGDIAVAVTDIPPGQVGRAELRGSGWSARNVHTAALTQGQRCRVQNVDGLMLHIVPE